MRCDSMSRIPQPPRWSLQLMDHADITLLPGTHHHGRTYEWPSSLSLSMMSDVWTLPVTHHASDLIGSIEQTTAGDYRGHIHTDIRINVYEARSQMHWPTDTHRYTSGLRDRPIRTAGDDLGNRLVSPSRMAGLGSGDCGHRQMLR